MAYATIAEVRARGVTPEAADDNAVANALTRATVVIDAYCGRDFLKREETLHVDGTGKAAIFLDDRPVIEVLDLKADDEFISAMNYVVYGEAGYIRLNGDSFLFGGHPGVFPKGAQNVKVYGWFGYEEVPLEVKEACILLALLFLRKMSAEADVAEPQANTTDKAVGIKRVKIDDLSVEYEYPRDVAIDASRRNTTGLAEADRLLLRFRRNLEARAV